MGEGFQLDEVPDGGEGGGDYRGFEDAGGGWDWGGHVDFCCGRAWLCDCVSMDEGNERWWCDMSEKRLRGERSFVNMWGWCWDDVMA